MSSIRKGLIDGSHVAMTAQGPIECAIRGEGPTILVLHGAGGGYDQGLLIAETFVGEGFRWVAPSRFGYLRSPLPEDASTPAQADALAALLDEIASKRVAIVAFSGGSPPALQFAIRHPERIEALVLLSSAPFTPMTAGDQAMPVSAFVYQALFASDFPYWALVKLVRGRIAPMFDIRSDLQADLSPEEEAFSDRIVAAFQLVTARVAGVRNEGAAIDPAAAYSLESIRAPTLIVHAKDDRLNPYSVAERLTAGIEASQLYALPAGGHLLLGSHAEIRARVAAFLHEHVTDGAP